MNSTSSRRTAVVLTNPTAGAGRAKDAIAPALAALRRRGLEVTSVTAGSREEAVRRCREAAANRPDLLVSIGGDGTHAVAAQAAVEHDVPLAVVPTGTGNDLARSLDLPRGDPEAAVEVAVTGRVRRIDVARVATETTERYYLTVLTCGFDSLVADRTNVLRWPHGRARYVAAIGIEYARLATRPFRVTVDGEVVHDGHAILAAVGNTDSYGGGMRMCAGADPGDGLLDVTLIDAVPHPRLELPRVLPRIFRGTHLDHPAVHVHRGRRLEVDCPGVNGYADGDSVGALPVTIEALPGRLGVLTPFT